MKRVRQQLKEFATAQWTLHQKTIPVTGLQAHHAKSIKQTLPHLIFGSEDKAPHRVHAFCPLLVAQMTQSTFSDTQVFEEVNLTVEEAERCIPLSLPPSIKKCTWAFPKKKNPDTVYLPKAFILPKRKKAFLKSTTAHTSYPPLACTSP